MNATITLREYLDKGKCFVIPNYQRGYIWGKKRADRAKDSVNYMMESLEKGFDAGTEVFIQGVTVTEQDEEIVLIDGQQRTTFFYLLLKSLGFQGKFQIRYDIRSDSNDFLAREDLLTKTEDRRDEKFQDIYFFKKSLRTIKEHLNEIEDKAEFLEYLLEKIKFLYINIPQEKATKVFTMMNGNKAEMKAEELIKAELLRLASMNAEEPRNEGEAYAIEWENNMLRSRYAREWDKWLQWWNREDVRKLFFKDEGGRVMGLLVETYQKLGTSRPLSFENFRSCFLDKQSVKQAKQTFDGLRRLQKRFEDAFNDPKTHNWVGAIIRIFKKENKDTFIKWCFLGKKPINDGTKEEKLYSLGEKPTKDELGKYYKLAFLGLSHSQIVSYLEMKDSSDLNASPDPESSPDAGADEKPDIQKEIDRAFDKYHKKLETDSLYEEEGDKEDAFRLLLRLNIDEDNLQEKESGRKFDFSIWDDGVGRSLEHIFPKSKVYHEEEQEDGTKIIKNGNDEEIVIKRDKDGTEHISKDGKEIMKIKIERRDDGSEVIKDDKGEIMAAKPYIWREDCRFKETVASEHSIGNLVLLYRDENSKFKDSPFEVKKNWFFKKESEDKAARAAFKSRHLLHTIYTFANSKWDGEEIAKHKKNTLNDLEKYYEGLITEKWKEM